MHIVVCIKQVPDCAQIRVHPVTNTIMRQGVPTIINPYDLFALEEAMRLRDTHGGEVTVLTMGPPMAEDLLRKALTYRGRPRGAADRPLFRRLRHAGDQLTRLPRRSARSARPGARPISCSPASRPLTAIPLRSVPASPAASISSADLCLDDLDSSTPPIVQLRSNDGPRADRRACEPACPA